MLLHRWFYWRPLFVWLYNSRRWEFPCGWWYWPSRLDCFFILITLRLPSQLKPFKFLEILWSYYPHNPTSLKNLEISLGWFLTRLVLLLQLTQRYMPICPSIFPTIYQWCFDQTKLWLLQLKFFGLLISLKILFWTLLLILVIWIWMVPLKNFFVSTSILVMLEWADSKLSWNLIGPTVTKVNVPVRLLPSMCLFFVLSMLLFIII